MSNLITHPIVLIASRLVVGGVFLLYGIAKALAPLDQFIQSINDFHMVPTVLVPTFAVIMIAVEIAVGLGLILGIYTRYATYATAILLVMFMIAIGQAVARGLDLPDCGCAGDFIKIGDTPGEVFGRDVVFLIMLIPLYLKQRGGELIPWSVDKWFERKV